MSRFHLYITPFADDTGSAYGDEVEVTQHLTSDGVGDIAQALDNTEYDIGVFRNGNFNLKLLNDTGKYSPAGSTESIFKYKRGGSLFRVTWEPGNFPLICGFFQAGLRAYVSEEVTIFSGLIKDDATSSDIDDEIVNFAALGYESLLATMTAGESGETPYDSINVGDTLSQVIFKLLDQAPFNELVDVQAENIVTGTSATIDVKTELQNKTVLEALQELLLASNSVLYIRDGVVYVSARTAGAELAYTFYGQASSLGIENVVNIQGYRNGENRIFNFVTWKDTTTRSSDASSIEKYQVQKKEIELSVITDTTKRTTLLNAIVAEFAQPKREFDLITPIRPDRLDLFLLDKVSVDYPSMALLPPGGRNVAIYQIGEYDRDYYAESVFALTIESSARFKIMSRRVNFRDETITFHLREI